MKVRSLQELQDKLDAEISWRKKELVDYKFVIEKNKKSTAVTPLIRGGISLCYAHWEGFVKMSSLLYTSYISTLKVPLKDIKINFVALNFKKKFNKINNIDWSVIMNFDFPLALAISGMNEVYSFTVSMLSITTRKGLFSNNARISSFFSLKVLFFK